MSKKITKYHLSREATLRTVPGGFEVHYMRYEVKSDDGQLSALLFVPCRSRLHHSLTGLFYNWDWKDERSKEVTFEEAMMLKHIFDSQGEYKLWKQTLEKINKEGVAKAKQWLIDQIKVLTLRKVMKGE